VILVYKVSLRGLRSGEKPKSEEHAAATRQSRLETVRSYYGYLKRVKYQEGKLMEHLPVWIVGLQNDLRDSGVVSSKEGIELARSLGCEFMECSAKDGQKNIEKCVLNVMRDVKRQKIK
jgi:GTPase SAR1 family protein